MVPMERVWGCWSVWGMHKALAGIWVPRTLALPWNCMASVFLWGHNDHQNKEGSRVKVMETVNGAGSMRGIDNAWKWSRDIGLVDFSSYTGWKMRKGTP